MPSSRARHAIVALSRKVLNRAYRRALARGQRQDEVLFLSRQADEPSYDFAKLARAFQDRGWAAKFHLKKVSARNLPSYARHILQEARLLARCKVAVLDRYDPAISLIDFAYEAAGTDQAAGRSGHLPHDEFPVQPVVFQMWHAFGAFKKFGYQSIDTREGHSADVVDAFNIHRNYSWVACSGEDARQAFAEAFAYPVERVVALPRPERDELLELAARMAAQDDTGTGVLMAPTLRKSQASAHPFRELYGMRETFEAAVKAPVKWAFHPLDAGLPAPGNVSDALLSCECVVTDYSSIVYEAYLLGKKVLFYVPDIDAYRLSPGLNADPLETCPELCAQAPEELQALLNRYAGPAATDPYPADALVCFAASAFDGSPAAIDAADAPAAHAIADFLIERASSR